MLELCTGQQGADDNRSRKKSKTKNKKHKIKPFLLHPVENVIGSKQ